MGDWAMGFVVGMMVTQACTYHAFYKASTTEADRAVFSKKIFESVVLSIIGIVLSIVL